MDELITTYWWLFIAIFAAGCVIGNYIINFFKLPSSNQVAKIKEWLLWAVAAAEKELGSGTGQLKLRYVYGMFTQTWTNVAKVIPFETFNELVDEALVRFSNMLQTNKSVTNYIEGEKNA